MQAVYDDMWSAAARNIRRGEVQIDAQAGRDGDLRRGLTLIFRPDDESLTKLEDFIADAEALERQQYFYPRADLHTTVLSIVSCEPHFSLDTADAERYTDVVASCLENIPAFTVDYAGVTATLDCVLAQGFSQGDALERLRAALRQAFGRSALHATVDTRYAIKTAHTSLMRFTRPLQHARALHDLIAGSRRRNLGHTIVKEVNLVANDWYMSTDTLENVATFELG